MKYIIPVFLILALSAAALAQDSEKALPGPISASASAGLVFPQVATELGTTWSLQLEGSYALLLENRLGVYTELGYTQPRVSRLDLMDPRVGTYEGTQTQKQLILGVGVAYRLSRPGSQAWNAYAGVGPRIYFLETVTEGSTVDSESFGENTESSTRVGGVLTLGGEYYLGKLAVLAEFELGSSDLPHTITGDVSAGAVTTQIGARMFF